MKRPKEQFATGDVMRTNEEYKGSFRTKDPPPEGGLQIVHGKLDTDVKRLGREDAPTKTQKYTLEQKDFRISQGRLVPTTTRGRRELRSIKEDVGELTYIGEKEFIPTREKKAFQSYSYTGGSKNMPRGRPRKGISSQEVTGARRRGVPESIISKMTRSQELTLREKDILNSKGLGYKVGFTKADGTKVRSHTFSLKTKYGKRSGRKRGGQGGSSRGNPIEVKPGLPRGAYS